MVVKIACCICFLVLLLAHSSGGFSTPLARRSLAASTHRLYADTKGDEIPVLTSKEKKIAALCEERNLPLENVTNSRDLATPDGSPIKPGRLYRTACLSGASPKDIEFLKNDLGIKTIVDLRSPTELKEDGMLFREEVFGDFTNILWIERGRSKEGCLRELSKGQLPFRRGGFGTKFLKRLRFSRTVDRKQESSSSSTPAVDNVVEGDVMVELVEDELVVDDDDSEGSNCGECGTGSIPANQSTDAGNRRERYFVSFMNELKYARGTASKVRKRDLAKSVLKSPGFLSRRVRSSIKKPFLKKINDEGLTMVNEFLLRYGAPGIRFALELCADKSRHPICFHCTAGKDRSGVVAMLILSILGVPEEGIVEDYALSANAYTDLDDHKAKVAALDQRDLDPRVFLIAPPEVMRSTIEGIRTQYGSVEEYLDWIGFGEERREKLREALMN